MSSSHLKRLVAPRSWSITRKERTWTTKPMPGKHSLEGAIPISTILRDYLNVCDNNRDTVTDDDIKKKFGLRIKI